MTIHPWTNYEIARLRDEERLLRARAATHAAALRTVDEPQVAPQEESSSRLARILRRSLVAERAQAGSGT